MKTYQIAVVPGDGTGPEVVREGQKVIDAVAAKEGYGIKWHPYDFGGDRYLRTGETLPDSAVEELGRFKAIFLGAIGHPDVKPGILEQGILLKLRFALDQYINLRPVKLFPGIDCPLKNKRPEDIDFVVVRENSAGIYTGLGGTENKGRPSETAIQIMKYTRSQVDRCLKFAFELTARRERKKLTLCHKTNVLTYTGDLWMRAFEEMGEKYPSVKRDYAHVDATTMWMVKNPEFYDVIVTENMFGDIITDLGAQIQGGMGVAAGGNINPEGSSMFEPIGGSAPKYTGKNVINPLAAILAGAMMMEQLGETKSGARIEGAVISALKEGKIKSMGAGQMGMGTKEVGDLIARMASA
jgi:3-isopropylmalate dehydrogenase